MVYESFNNSKNKLQKSWERSEENENNLTDIPLIELDFNSINFNKKIVTIPIVTDELVTSNNKIQSILLENFPEWVINMIEVNCIYTMEDAFTNFLIVDSFAEAEDGDIIIVSQEFDYWFNNIDEINYNLKIFLDPFVGQKIPEFTSFPAPVPVFMTLSLKIVNQRIYETMNSHKE